MKIFLVSRPASKTCPVSRDCANVGGDLKCVRFYLNSGIAAENMVVTVPHNTPNGAVLCFGMISSPWDLSVDISEFITLSVLLREKKLGSWVLSLIECYSITAGFFPKKPPTNPSVLTLGCLWTYQLLCNESGLFLWSQGPAMAPGALWRRWRNGALGQRQRRISKTESSGGLGRGSYPGLIGPSQRSNASLSQRGFLALCDLLWNNWHKFTCNCDRKLLKPHLDPQLLLIGIMKYGVFTSMKQVYENHVSILHAASDEETPMTFWKLIYWAPHHHGDPQGLCSSCKKLWQVTKKFDVPS